jgi:hypothetical protein
LSYLSPSRYGFHRVVKTPSLRYSQYGTLVPWMRATLCCYIWGNCGRRRDKDV